MLPFEFESPLLSSHSSCVCMCVCVARGCVAEDIHDFDLNLVDTQPACIGGPMNEFVFSPRLDNLCMSFCALQVCSHTHTQTHSLYPPSLWIVAPVGMSARGICG